MARHGFGSSTLGYFTRKTFNGGRRIGFLPIMRLATCACWYFFGSEHRPSKPIAIDRPEKHSN